MPFQKGQSGNPAGRNKGLKNRATLALQKISHPELIAIVDNAIELAAEGHPYFARWCLEQVAPAPKFRATDFRAQPIKDVSDVDTALDKVNDALFAGTISLEDSTAAGEVLRITTEVLKRRKLRARLAELEKSSAPRNKNGSI
jgi:hypothetical protein